MCGRFTQYVTWAEVHAILDMAGATRNLGPHDNIPPTPFPRGV